MQQKKMLKFFSKCPFSFFQYFDTGALYIKQYNNIFELLAEISGSRRRIQRNPGLLAPPNFVRCVIIKKCPNSLIIYGSHCTITSSSIAVPRPGPMKIVIIKKCPKLLRIYGSRCTITSSSIAVPRLLYRSPFKKCPELLRIYGSHRTITSSSNCCAPPTLPISQQCSAVYLNDL